MRFSSPNLTKFKYTNWQKSCGSWFSFLTTFLFKSTLPNICQWNIRTMRTTILHATPALTLCPSCYIDGRTCRCGSMIPVQCRRFDDLISDRERVAQVLTRVL